MKKDPANSKNAKKADKPKPQPLQKLTIQAQYNFNNSELVLMSKEQSGLYNEIERLQDQLAHTAKDFKSRISGLEARQKELNNKIGSGYEMRDTEVFVEMLPKERKKKYFRIVGNGKKGDFIREEAMSPADFVVEMKLNDPRRPKEEPKTPVVTPDGKTANPVLPPAATADNPTGKPEAKDGDAPADGKVIELPKDK